MLKNHQPEVIPISNQLPLTKKRNRKYGVTSVEIVSQFNQDFFAGLVKHADDLISLTHRPRLCSTANDVMHLSPINAIPIPAIRISAIRITSSIRIQSARAGNDA